VEAIEMLPIERSAVKSEYPILGLVREAFPCRIPGPRFGVYGSLVMVAPCNMACPYCDVAGYAKDRHHNLPGWRMSPLDEIDAFVEEEVAAGRLIYLTGGEPFMFPELISYLGRRIRGLGGHSVVCTNATLGKRMMPATAYIDGFSVSLKGTPQIADYASGVDGRMAFATPYRNSLALLESDVTVEMVVVLFEEMDFDTVRRIYEPFIGRAHLTLKEYRPKLTRAQEDHSYHTDLVNAAELGKLRPLPADQAEKLFEELRSAFPEHSEYIHLVMGGGGEQVVVTNDREHVFVR
jgi:pyruvate-formate lyase-activating enzyme